MAEVVVLVASGCE
uniref:Uncharacterized protein n=1 Tax=Arundo donax TaxID=35708 RepID=A0A0A8YS13_ARUDO